MFNGILNNNGFEQKIRINFNNYANYPYVTDAYIDDIKSDCIVNKNSIRLLSTTYYYHIRNSLYDEILIVGKENKNIFHSILCCLYNPKYFVLTNKQEV